MNPLTDLLAGTIAADHPKIATLATAVASRAKQGRAADREKALLADLVERSRARRAARLARLPRPSYPQDLPIAETHSDRELRAYDTIIVDEAHERSLNVDFLLGYLKRLLDARPELKVIVTSATIDTERFSRFFDGAPVIEVSGRTYPVEVRYRPEFFEREDPSEGLAGKVAEDDEPVDMPEAIAKAVD